MNIIQKEKGKKGYFKALDNELEAGIMTYVWVDEAKFIIDHTIVNKEFEGKGVGKQLVMAAVDFARKKNVKIQPDCPYAKSVFEKNKEIQDVLF